jgi:hypothetical protein
MNTIITLWEFPGGVTVDGKLLMASVCQSQKNVNPTKKVELSTEYESNYYLSN